MFGKKMRIGIVILCGAVICTSCVTNFRNEPVADDSSMIIGTARMRAQNFGAYGDATVDGYHTDDLYVTLVSDNDNSEEVLRVCGRNGFWGQSNLPAGMYWIKKIEFKDSKSSSWANIWFNTNIKINVNGKAGSVQNIGFLEIEADKQIEKYTVKLIETNPEEIKERFSEQYPKSVLNQYDWEQCH